MHITDILSHATRMILTALQLPGDFDKPLLSGLFEITLGSKLVSATDAALLQQAVIVSFILGFSGFCVQAQVAGILAETDIRFKPFLSLASSREFMQRSLFLFFGSLFTHRSILRRSRSSPF